MSGVVNDGNVAIFQLCLDGTPSSINFTLPTSQ